MIEPRVLIQQFRQPTAATCMAALIIGSTAWGMVPDMFTFDREPDTYYFVLPYVQFCDPYSIPIREDSLTRNPLKWWLNCASFQWFDNYKLIPAIFGIGIMPLVYILAVRMTNDRLLGMISLVAFIHNPLYTDWATSGTYDQSWAFFVILSLCLLFGNKPKLAIVSFITGMITKSMAIALAPMFAYTMYRQHGIKPVIATILCISGIIAVGASTLGVNMSVGTAFGFYPDRWEDAIFRNISLFWQVMPFFVFVLLNVNFKPTYRMPHHRTVIIWMIGMLMINPLVYLFTTQDTYSYRYVPLAAFMSIFVGMTIIQLGNWVVERKIGVKPLQHL